MPDIISYCVALLTVSIGGVLISLIMVTTLITVFTVITLLEWRKNDA